MKAKIYSLDGTTTSQIELPDETFKVAQNDNLVTQAVLASMANKRRAIAHTKDRSEVSGGGRKPYKQKGTGNARVGSSRSPIWIGGGITFGPRKNRNYSKRMPLKMRQKALKIALSQKVPDSIIVVKNFDLKTFKTSQIQGILEKLPLGEGKILAVCAETRPNWELATANLPFIKTVLLSGVNLIDVLLSDYIVYEKSAIEKMTGKTLITVEKEVKEKIIEKKAVKTVKKITSKKVVKNADAN